LGGISAWSSGGGDVSGGWIGEKWLGRGWMRGKMRETSFVSLTFVAHQLFALSRRPAPARPLWTRHGMGAPDGKYNRAGPNLSLGGPVGRDF
jgi:hypothetical protein